MEIVWFIITLMGTPELWTVIGVVPLAYLIIKNKRDEEMTLRHRKLTLFAASILSVVVIVIIMKTLLAVPRPCIPCTSAEMSACNPYCPSGVLDYYSFPSGHAASIFSGVVAIMLASRKKAHVPLLVIPILVSLSRYYLGVHTPVDIAAGAIIGIAVPCGIFLAFRHMTWE